MQRRKSCINFGGQGKPNPIMKIKDPTRGTRRKRRRMNFEQKNLIMITSKEIAETRPDEIMDN